MAKAKVKVPKTLGGVKIPRRLRKSSMVSAFLNTELGRNILADVLVAAAGAAAAAMARHRPSGQQIAQAGEAAMEGGQRATSTATAAVHSAAGTLGNVLTEAVRYVFPTDHDRKDRKRGKKVNKSKRRELTVAHKQIKKTRNTGQASRRHH
jgi:hypothetical protein